MTKKQLWTATSYLSVRADTKQEAQAMIDRLAHQIAALPDVEDFDTDDVEEDFLPHEDDDRCARCGTPLVDGKCPEDPHTQTECIDCGHPISMHHRTANGAYRCSSFGCGCERASV